MMLSAGASEQAVSQWASTFAERGLGVSKTVGDLAGPMSFALLMGISRAFYGKYGDRIDLDKFMKYSALLCILSYLCIAFLPIPALGLAGCAICGLSVGIMWPGNLQQSFRFRAKRRNRHVCPLGSGRRPRLLRRSNPCRYGFQRPRR